MNKPKNSPVRKIIAENRKARFNFEILDTLEAGLVLTGTEVVAARQPVQHSGKLCEL